MNTFIKAVSTALCISTLAFSGGCFLNDTINDARGQLFETINFDDDSKYTEIQQTESVNSPYYTSNSVISKGYDYLQTESQRQCYSSIGEAAYRVSETANEFGLYPIGKVTVQDKTFTERDAELCIKTYTMDHPGVFWIANRYTYGAAGNQFIIQLYSFLSGTDCRTQMIIFNDTINGIMTSIPKGLNQYHLEKYIHDVIMDKSVYADGIVTADGSWEEFSAYGALVKGSAVCEGYSHAAALLLNKVGIECYYINGRSETESHMWNCVKIDGNWYNLDITWDDSENAYYHYFNVPDSIIKRDHTIAPLFEYVGNTAEEVYNIFLPECNSDSANFFVVESTFIDDFEDCREVMVNDLIEAAKNRDTEFTVRFDSSMDFNESMDLMFNKDPYYMFSYISDANEQLEKSEQINDQNASIIILESFRSVVVKLTYK